MFKIVATCLLFAQLAWGLEDGEPHIINDCLNPGDNATLVYNQEISKSGGFFQIQEETLRIPDNGFFDNKITCVTVTNLDSDSEAGYPKIKAGGVGSTYVTLHLESQRGKGFDFQVSVYSAPS